MRKAIDYLRAHPIIPIAIAIGLVGILILRPWPTRPVTTAPPAPMPVATPAPPAATPALPPTAGPVPTPAPGAPPTAEVPGAVDAGRPDPFAPLVRPAVGPALGVPVPPPAPLPPPLFPGAPGMPGAPAPMPTPEAPPPPPKEASMAQLVGILGNADAVAIIRLEGRTYIVSVGERIMEKIRVSRIDVERGLVILEQEGEQFELTLGEVRGANVATTAPSRIF